jgi:nuclear pore complex protein Nup155
MITECPFLKRKLAGIPEGLFQYFTGTRLLDIAHPNDLIPRAAANTISHMGLMPEIDRAWVTIDNKLFLWDYVEGYATSHYTPSASELTLLATGKR